MLPAPAPAVSPAVIQFVQDHLDALRSAAADVSLPDTALRAPDCAAKLAVAVYNQLRIFSSHFGSMEEILESPPHRALALRSVARAVALQANGLSEPAAIDTKAYEWTVLSAANLLDGNQQEHPQAYLEEHSSRVPILYSPDPEVVTAISTLESVTGLPWRTYDDRNAENRGSRCFEREYVCRVDNEGVAHTLLRAFRDLTSEHKLFSCTWITRKGEPGLAVVIDAEFAEHAAFQREIANSDNLRELKSAFQKGHFAKHYTKFQHQGSAESEVAAKGAAYEEIVCAFEQIFPDAMFASEAADLTRTDCLEPQPRSNGGFALFYEHQVSRALTSGLIARLMTQAALPSTTEPWNDEVFPYDRRYELHLPLKLIQTPDFRELVRSNREIYELFRAIALQDRALFADLADAIEDRVSLDLEKKVPVAESTARDESLRFDTALTRSLRRHILNTLIEGPYDETQITNAVEALQPSALNRILREHSLLYLLEHEEEREPVLTELLSQVRTALGELGAALSEKSATRSAYIDLDERFGAAAERYMDSLDACAARWRG